MRNATYTFRKRSVVSDPGRASPLWRVDTQHFAKTNSEKDPYVVVNEYIAASIAQYLRVPTPAFAVLKKSKSSEPMFSSLIFGGLDSTPRDCDPERCMQCVGSEAVGITLFDILIGNSDRHFGNVLVDNVDNPKSILAIDHGQSLLSTVGPGRIFELYDMSNIGIDLEYSGEPWHCFLSLISSESMLYPWLPRIESIPRWYIEDVCISARGLGVPIKTLKAIAEMISFRSQRLGDIIKMNRNFFPLIKKWRPSLF